MAELTIPVVVNWDDIKDRMAEGNIVEVIRCKDCKHWQFFDSVKAKVCKRRYDQHYWQSHEDDYCSRAERREE